MRFGAWMFLPIGVVIALVSLVVTVWLAALGLAWRLGGLSQAVVAHGKLLDAHAAASDKRSDAIEAKLDDVAQRVARIEGGALKVVR